MMSAKPNVLFLDDDYLLIKAVELITRDSSFQFHLSSSVREARQLIKTKSFQIIFSDFHMPECNGVEFLAEAAKLCPSSVRILVSASLNDKEAKKALKEQHIFSFLKKPFGRASFNQSLQEAMQAWENRNLS
jgi:DNA-binding NtrC family response regulator